MKFFKTLQKNAKVTVFLLTDNSLKKPIHLVKVGGIKEKFRVGLQQIFE